MVAWQYLTSFLWGLEEKVEVVPRWKYTPAFLDALKNEGVVLSEATKAAHEEALHANGAAGKALVFEKTTAHPYSLFNFPGIGPSVPVKLLGSGGFGSVEKHVAADGRVFAVKTITALRYYSHQVRKFEQECFEAEREVTQKMGRLLAVEELTDSQWRFAIPYFEGSTLSQHVTTKFISSYQLIMIMIGMVDELDKMHKLGYLHNDVTENNFMVKPEATIVNVIDFGYARKINTIAIGGSIEFIVPETFQQREAMRTVASETFALGVNFRWCFLRSMVFAAPLIYFCVVRDMLSERPENRPALTQVRQNLISLFNKISMILAATVGLSMGLALGFEKVNVLEQFSVAKKDQHSDLMNTGIAIMAALFTFCASYQVQKPYRTLLLSRGAANESDNNNIKASLLINAQ